MKKLFALTALLASSFVAQAVEETGKVDYLTAISSNGTVAFNLVMENKPAPSCGNDSRWSLKISGTGSEVEMGKMQYAMVLAALNSGKAVTVKEHSVCQVAPYGRFADSIKARP